MSKAKNITPVDAALMIRDMLTDNKLMSLEPGQRMPDLRQLHDYECAVAAVAARMADIFDKRQPPGYHREVFMFDCGLHNRMQLHFTNVATGEKRSIHEPLSAKR